MKRILALLPFLFFVVACSSGESTQEKVNKIFEVHDEAMPKIGEVMSLKKRVEAKAGESENAEELNHLATELENAQQNMMNWMHEWSAESGPYVNEEASKEEAAKFFKSQMEKVTKVRDDINSSIAKANKALQDN